MLWFGSDYDSSFLLRAEMELDPESCCDLGSSYEKHARVFYDRLSKLEWREKLLSQDLNELTSRKDINEWKRLNEKIAKLGDKWWMC
jgi:hypothetical protein